MGGLSSTGVLFQILVNGILFGSMYGVAAIGLSLIFGSMEIIFIAQGAVIVLAAYVTYFVYTATGLDPYFCLLLCLPLFMGLGWLFYMGLFDRVAGAGKNPSLLLAFGLMVLLESLMAVAFTPNPRAIKTTYTAMGIALGPIQISFTRLMVFFINIVTSVSVFLFMKKTLWGKSVRAASEDMGAAALLGISPRRVRGLTFALGLGLAGIAGVATATTYPFDPYFGFLFSIKALIAVAIGGLGSVGGALLGGIVLGLIESIGSYLIGGGWADAVSYAAFLLLIMGRPQGLFGRKVRMV